MKEKLESLKIGEVIRINLKEYSTYKTGGYSLFVYIDSIKSLIKLLKYLNKNKTKYKVIGNASNLIFSDSGYSGVLISLSKINYLKKYSNYFTVSAGYSLMKFSVNVSNLEYTGMEFASGIPGQIGGAVFMNGGAYGHNISDYLYKVKVLDDNYKVKTLYRKDLYFGYRDSFLKKNKSYILLEATFKLDKSNKEDILNLIEEYREKRYSSQPLEYPNAGSVFRNPEGDYAARLIDSLNLKDKSIGGAYVSVKHANFIINKEEATSEDIIKLIEYIKKEVKDNYGIDLVCEQEIVEE